MKLPSTRPETEALRNRLSRLSEASLRITESLDLDTILQGVIDGARSLTGARYGALVVLDDAGGMQDLVTSGMTPEERQSLGALPKGLGLLGYLNEIEGPLRLAEIASHPNSSGFPEGHPPMKTFLGAPVRHRGERLGNIYLTEKEGGQEFTPQDEETLVMFASQAALTVSNAHRYRDEERVRADLEAVIDTSPVGILIFDAKTGDLVSLNQETRRIVRGLHAPDHSLSALLSVMSFRRLDGREVPPDELPTARAIRTGETVRAEELVIHLPDGHAITTVINATPVRSAEGEVVSVIATVQDMTPLEELERLRAEFLGMVSHELRTPLTTIKGSAASALSSASPLNPAEAHHLFRIIDKQADHMRRLINDLLDVTRIEAGTLSITPETSGVVPLVNQARAASLSGGAQNNIEINLSADLPPIAADRQRVVQVLTNLLSNASKYSPASSTIRVTASQQGSHVAVTIADEGRGLSAEDLLQLFRKFSRINGTDGQPDVGGEGLGLSVCKGIVEAHGGRIWAESDGPGLGTRFTFTIPVVEADGTDAADGPDELAALPREAASQTRILAVDDDPQILRYVRHTLSEAGYTTIGTGDPEQVERLVEVEEPHLILLDLALPGTNGFELMKGIRDITDAPVMFLSGHGTDQNISRGLEMGAADYVVKPFSPTELVARIKAALRKGAAPGRTEPRAPYVLGDLTINYADRRVSVAGRSVRLSATEYKLLAELSVNAGRVLTHGQLLRRVWDQDDSEGPQVLRTYVTYLRSKLGDDARSPTYIFTEPRVGYRMAKAGRGRNAWLGDRTTVRIVTDSCSDLPPEAARTNGITVVPLYVIIGGETYRDSVDMTADSFYSRLVELPSLPTTSQPSVGDFQEVYRRLLDEGHQIVSIHVSSKLSGTLNSAAQARESLGDAAQQIEVVDSRLAGGAQALLALSAARWARELADHHEVARRVERSIERNHGFVVVDTLKYLAMGGRIGRAQALLGGVLQFKPIVGIRDGETHPVDRPRTRRRAQARIVEIVRELAPIHQLHVSYSTGPDNAMAVRDELADLVEPERLIESRLGPVLGTHLGPNTVGVAATQGSIEEE